jgi:DNA-binding NtrC family response regulator
MIQRQGPEASDGATRLGGARVLVVEDDFIIAMELKSILLDAGAESVDICRNVKQAMVCADGDDFSAAMLDVRVGKEAIIPVARALARRRIPFIFYTGQVDLDAIRVEWPECTIISKPAQPRTIVRAVAATLKR